MTELEPKPMDDLDFDTLIMDDINDTDANQPQTTLITYLISCREVDLD